MKINELLKKTPDLKIAVIGDFIEDRYIYGDVTRISPEAPVPVVHKTNQISRAGGAGNVFMNLVNLDVHADLYCFSSDRFLMATLFGGYTSQVWLHPGVNSIKTRVMCGNHQIIRIDEELKKDEIEWHAFKQIDWWTNHLEKNFGEYNAIVMVDYHKGVLSDSLINAVMELANHYEIPVVVDAKRDYRRYSGAFIIKCNRSEYEAIPKNSDNLLHYGRKGIKVDNLVVTVGEQGISIYHEDTGEGIDGYPINIVDVCGAGDTVTALLAAATAAGYGVLEACEIANVAASEVCRHPGVYPITKEDLIKRCKEVGYGI